ncbi:MAG: hypothetical protein ACXVWZ_04680 [Nocardioides sp.]
MSETTPTRVLVVTDHPTPDPVLLRAIEERVGRGPAQFRVVVPNPAAAEIHLLHPERHERAAAAESVLRDALPALERAAGGPVIGSVSVRHDPMDAVEEVLHSEPVQEIVVSVHDHRLAARLHQDLAHRLAHHGLPVTHLTPTG